MAEVSFSTFTETAILFPPQWHKSVDCDIITLKHHCTTTFDHGLVIVAIKQILRFNIPYYCRTSNVIYTKHAFLRCVTFLVHERYLFAGARTKAHTDKIRHTHKGHTEPFVRVGL